MDYTLSRHAEDAIREREILPEWLAQTMARPVTIEPDPNDPDLQHAL